MALDFETLGSALASLLGLVSLAFIPLVLVRRKEPSSAIAWILALIFIPLVGVVLFWFLGRDRVRSPVKARLSATRAIRERLASIGMRHAESVLPATASDQLGVMRLASLVSEHSPARGNVVELLVGAPSTYDAMIAAIDEATDHVHLEYYILRPDDSGRRMLAALVRAAERGVRVRLLYDGFGSRLLTRRFLAPLRRAGGFTSKFFPLDPVRRAWSINLRNHRKLMVVDGRVGFAGGINVGDEFLPWHDLHLRVEGPAVGQLQSVFVEDWLFATSHDLADPAFFPVASEDVGDCVVQVVHSGPDGTVEAIHRLYFAAIASAREHVFITTPYFVPDRAILVALQTAALRGVDVRLILPRHSNHRVTFHAGRSFYDELLGAGVRIHEYQKAFLHSKTMIVDGVLATVGSANFDVRSFRLNFELIAVLWGDKVVAELMELFERDLEETREVTLADWRERGVVMRLKEGVGRLCAPLL